MPTHYETLSVTANASESVITASYRALMRQHHPDIAGAGEEEIAGRINAAYAALSDPARRAAYDQSLATELRMAPEPHTAPKRAGKRAAAPAFAVAGAEKILWSAIGAISAAVVSATVAVLVAEDTARVLTITVALILFGLAVAAVFNKPLTRVIIIIIAGVLTVYQGGTAAGVALAIQATLLLAGFIIAAVLLSKMRTAVAATSWQRLIETADERPGSDVFFVLNVDQADGRAHALLERLESTERVALQMWGSPVAGTYIAVSSDAVMLGSAPGNAPEAWEKLSAI